MQRIFLDTEFSNFENPQLISIGMCIDSGGEFYAEMPVPYEACSQFVKDHVLIHLDKGSENKCATKEILVGRMAEWLSVMHREFNNVEICVDFELDWVLFKWALNDVVPDWCRYRLIFAHLNEERRRKYYVQNNLPEHHALYDARANQYAFNEHITTTRAQDFF